MVLDSDTESEGRVETGDHAAPDATASEAMEEEGSEVSATDSSTSDMQIADTPPTHVTGKRRRKRRLPRLIRRNGGDPTNPTDSLVLAMLAAEPPVIFVNHEADATELLEAMYQQDEERLRMTVQQGHQFVDAVATGLPNLEGAEIEYPTVLTSLEHEPVGPWRLCHYKRRRDYRKQ